MFLEDISSLLSLTIADFYTYLAAVDFPKGSVFKINTIKWHELMSLLQGRVGLADTENWERLQTCPKQGCRKELFVTLLVPHLNF